MINNNKIKVRGDGPRSSFSMDLYNSCDRWDLTVWNFVFEYLFGWTPIYEYWIFGIFGGSIAVVDFSVSSPNSWIAFLHCPLLTIVGSIAHCDPISQISSTGINVNFGGFNFLPNLWNILKIFQNLFQSKLTTNCLFEPLCPFQSLLDAIQSIKEIVVNKVEIWSSSS